MISYTQDTPSVVGLYVLLDSAQTGNLITPTGEVAYTDTTPDAAALLASAIDITDPFGWKRYRGAEPGWLPRGLYEGTVWKRAGANPAKGDAFQGSSGLHDWTGAAVAGIATLGGVGDRTVILTLQDQASLRVPGLSVTIQSVAEDVEPLVQVTDEEGQVAFNLFDGAYHVLVHDTPYYQHLAAQALVVAGPTAATYTLSAVVGLSYVAPTADYIILRTGVRALTERLSDLDFANKLLALKPAAEAKVALRLTEAVFFSATLTEAQAQALRDAVACRTAVNYLASPGTERATGTHETLALMAADEIARMRRELSAEARELEALILGGSARLRALLRAYS